MTTHVPRFMSVGHTSAVWLVAVVALAAALVASSRSRTASRQAVDFVPGDTPPFDNAVLP